MVCVAPAAGGTRTSDPAPAPDDDDLGYPRTEETPRPESRQKSRPGKEEESHSGLSPEMKKLRANVRRALSVYSAPRLNSRDHTPWEMMHSIIAYGVRSHVHEGGPDGRVINAIGCLCYNFPCRGYRVLDVQEGHVVARKGVGLQGHHGQLLAILAQSHVPVDYSMMCNDRKFTVADLVESEKRSCETGMELTFKLISLAHYLDLDTTWKNDQGETWSIQRLIKEEIQAPIVGAACGGTHRLMGLSYAVHKRRDSGEPLNGEYRRAKIYTDEFHAYTFKLQSADGSFSTDWFRGAASAPELGRRLQTTGHILEWLAYSLPSDELTNPPVVKAVKFLSDMLLADTQHQWEIGTLGHGLHSLALYDQRVFKPLDPPAGVVALAQEADKVHRLPGVISQQPDARQADAQRPDSQQSEGQPADHDLAEPEKPAEESDGQPLVASRGRQVPPRNAALRR